ncbi:hypothetical protein ElyMa_003360600 [Elysia marginata]|uniref:Peptidase M48 domain-containing protein n=1 Tax=Elysia marginata TaxID=1093978 RepID=A0AAV4JKA2_9GAST|nr:hypothetical protein ElyMa_003360600 [Elysia marginata]
MTNEIFEIMAPWAGVSTWYTTHPLDQERFSQVMANLVARFGHKIDIEEFEAALRKHAGLNPAILGNPKHWDEVISKFVLKAETILNYEAVK